MNKIYFSQIDSRWKNHPYPASGGYENKTIGTSGCGPTSAAMVVSAFKEIVYPDQMGDIFIENGYRVPGGTDADCFPFVADKWGLEYKRVYSSYDAHQACKEGWYVVINVAEGLWTTGGHYIVAVGATDNDIEIYDPYLYAGKFDNYGRSGKVYLNGTSAWVNIDVFKEYSNAQRFFCFKGNDIQPIPTTEEIMYVNTNNQRLNVRNAPGGDIIGRLDRGTQVTVYDRSGDWSRIGDGQWVSSQYLSDTHPDENPSQPDRNTVGEVKRFKNSTIIYSNSALSGTQYNYKANTTVTVLENTSDRVDKVRVRQTGREGYVDISVYDDSSTPMPSPSTVGQTKKFKKATIIYSNSDLSGTEYNYKANTSVTVLENTSATVDKVKVVMTGRIGYVRNNNYK